MAYLAASQKPQQSTAELATQLSGSPTHLAKVLQRLSKAGLVVSLRGPKGGFALARPAEQITLLEIWQAIDGEVLTCNCMQNPQTCDGTTCYFGRLLQRVNEYLNAELGQTTLADLRYDIDKLVALSPVVMRRPAR